jgi:hypothetical protein
MYQPERPRPTSVERATDRDLANKRSKLRARADQAGRGTWRRELPPLRRVTRAL